MRPPGWPVFLACVSGAALLGWAAGSALEDRSPADAARTGSRPGSDTASAATAATAGDAAAAPAQRIAELEREVADLRRSSRRAAPQPKTPPGGAPAPAKSASTVPEDVRRVVDAFLASLRAGTARGIPPEVAAAVVAHPELGSVLALAVTDASIPASERAALLRILGAANPAAVAGLLDRLLAPGEDAAIQSAALAAAESAAKAGHGVPSRVRELAMSPDVAPESAAAALRALLAAGGSDAAGAADRMLDSPDPAIRSRAAVALSGSSHRSLLPQMHRALRDVPDSHAGQLMNAIANAKDRPWSAIQITGEPDTIRGGDLGTAWAAKQPEMGLVTIELGYAEAVLIERIRIHETLCPGGVVEIAWRDGVRDGGRDGAGDWRPLWSGRADSGSAPRWFEAEPSVSVVAREIRLTIDTAVAQGWEEIDAVELVGGGGRQWASSARASSSYAD